MKGNWKLVAQMKTPRKTMCQLTKSVCELRIDTSTHTVNYNNHTTTISSRMGNKGAVL